MFTGIIEEVGKIEQVRKGEKSSVLTISAKKVLEGTKVGDSIAVNGICLTVTSLSENSFCADVMAETLRRTNLGKQTAESRVNLERALTPASRMGGHIVSGHIDDTASETTLLYKGAGNTVNLECDIIAKYVEKLMGFKTENKKDEDITEEMLLSYGFIQ